MTEGKGYLYLTAAPLFTVTASGKCKVNFTLEQTTIPSGGEEIYLYSFFNLGTRRGGWSRPRSGRLTPL